MILRNAFLSLDGTDLSNKVRQVSLPQQVMRQENTTMGATTETGEGGLEKWRFQVTFKQDFSAGSVDATLSAIKAAGDAVAIVLRPDSAAKGASNPEFTGSGLLVDYDPFGGTSVGGEVFVSVSFECAGDLTRAVA